MKQNICTMLWVAALIFMSNSISGQEVKTLDLTKGKSYSETVEKGTTLKFIIKNKIPKVEYKIVSVKKDRIPEVLIIPNNLTTQEGLSSDCRTSQAAVVDEIWNDVKDENDVPSAIQKSQAKIEELKKGTQETCTPEIIAGLNFQIEQTKLELDVSYNLSSSQTVEVTVIRDHISEDKEVKWHYKFDSPMEGQWVTTYGFSFVTPRFDKPENFFSQTRDSVFAITSENTKSRPQFIPSVFFTWLPNKTGWNGFNISGTGGLGFDFEAPTVFAGLSLFYHHNISLNIGLVAHQQEFLRGKYIEGQVIGENLSSDQLHEKLYSFNPFVSLSFRLGKSPFANNNIQPNSEETQ